MAQQQGLIHLYTGDGKGKTTASVGLATRARGSGRRVVFCQFMKGRETAELEALRSLGVTVVRQPMPAKFVFQMNDAEKAEYAAIQQDTLRQAKEAAADCDLLVLDEVISAVTTGMVDVHELTTFLETKPEGLEVVLTGRDAPEAIRRLAHYVTFMRADKHPFEQGVAAREGIEY